MNPSIELSLIGAAYDSIGTYCQGFQQADGMYQKRTDWQEGWNACHNTMLERQILVEAWFKGLPEADQAMMADLLVADEVSLHVTEERVEPHFLTSDLFAWGYADAEHIVDGEMLAEVYREWKKNGSDGILAWWCKRQNQKPQWPIEERWRKDGIWDAELEALPACEYDEKIGRWKTTPKPEWGSVGE